MACSCDLPADCVNSFFLFPVPINRYVGMISPKYLPYASFSQTVFCTDTVKYVVKLFCFWKVRLMPLFIKQAYLCVPDAIASFDFLRELHFVSK